MIRHCLDNGLTLLIDPSGTEDVAAAYLWIHVGSRDEPPGLEGAAHFLEHMLFKGTRSYAVGQVASTVEGWGGDINAWTSFEETCFHISIPGENLEKGLALLAEMLREAVLDPDELEKERLVILEEIRGCKEDPDLVLGEATYAKVYGKHPYARPIIGSVASVRGISQPALSAFYRRHYQPANATLAIAGKVEEEALLRLVRGLFGGGPARPPRPSFAVEPATGTKLLRRRFEGMRIETVFPGPGHGHPDVPALETLAMAFGGSTSSPLEARLRLRDSLCMSASAHYEAEVDSGLFTLYLHPRDGRSQDALAAMEEELQRLREGGIARGHLDRAKAQLLAQRSFARETSEGRAQELVFHHATQGDAEAWRSYDAAIAALSQAQIQQVIDRYLRPDKAARIALGPPGEELRLRTAAVPPRPRPARPIPQMQRVTLDNGLRILLEPDDGDVVALRLVGLGGALLESPALAGISTAWSRMLLRGAAGFDALQFATEVEKLGGNLGTPGGRSSQGVKLDLPSAMLNGGLEILDWILYEASFIPSELERTQQESLQAIKEAKDHPDAVLSDAIWSLCCPGHPSSLSPMGNPASVGRWSIPALRRLHRRWMQGSNLVLTLTGGFDPASVLPRLRRLLGKIPSTSSPISYAPPRFPSQTRRRTLRCGREQAQLAVAFPGVAVQDADQPAVETLATVLGGQGGRLFLELREQHGLAYSVGATSAEGVVPGLLSCSLGTDPDRIDEAEQRLMESLRRVREEAIPEQERLRAIAYLEGAARSDQQSAGSRAGAATYAELYGLDGVDYRRLARRVAQVDGAALRRAAERLSLPLAVVRVLPVETPQ